MKNFQWFASLALVLAYTATTQAAPFDTETKITAADAAADDWFGRSVAISGNTALVGARRDDDGGSDSGSAYLFDVNTGSQLAKLTASDAAEGDRFGFSVAISGNTALVGARRDDDGGFDSGSAYLFDVTTGNQIAKLTADDAEAEDWLGSSVAINGNTALVGQGETTTEAANLARRTCLMRPPAARLPSSPQTMLRNSTGLAPPWRLAATRPLWGHLLTTTEATIPARSICLM